MCCNVYVVTFRLGILLMPNMAMWELWRIVGWLFGCTTADELENLSITRISNAFKNQYANKRSN